MNQKEWKEFCKTDKAKAHYWYNKVTKKRISKEFESDPRTDKDAKVIHHLRDTEEQRAYNNEHYEMFGFEIDENGNEFFEYGKYVVFWTKEHHDEYHCCSEETRKKRSESIKKNPPMKGKHHTESALKKIRAARAKQMFSEETINKHRENSTKMWADQAFKLAHSGENAKMHGRKLSDEIKHNMSIARKSWWDSHPEKKLEMSDKFKGENNPNYGKQRSEDTKKKMSEAARSAWTDERREEHKNKLIAVREKYIDYKSNGGTMTWNEFQKYLKLNSKKGGENDKV